jgi:hypothetical protein
VIEIVGSSTDNIDVTNRSVPGSEHLKSQFAQVYGAPGSSAATIPTTYRQRPLWPIKVDLREEPFDGHRGAANSRTRQANQLRHRCVHRAESAGYLSGDLPA